MAQCTFGDFELCSGFVRSPPLGKAAGAEYQKQILVNFSSIDTCVIA